MCTLTWWRGEGGDFEVFFNRDEKKTRSRAEAPRVFQEMGVEFLSPRDPDGGGTWMLANEFGVVVCLLNRWHEEGEAPREWTSRGKLVWSLATARTAAAVARDLEGRALEDMKPFSLWTFDGNESHGLEWSGGRLGTAAIKMPVTSSSFRYAEVAAARQECFDQMQPESPDALQRYQESVGDGASAHTVRMCRPDAQTMSRSRLRVDGTGVVWEYLEEQPDFASPPEKTVVTLSRQ